MANEFVARNGIISKGGFTTPHKVVSSGYQITVDDYLIECSGSFTVTLPTAVGVEGKHYIIKNNGSLIITIATTSSQTIDGVTSMTLAAHSSIQLISTGANWINVLIGDSNTLDGLDSTSFALTTSLNGTQNYLTKYGATGITQSLVYDNGTNVGINTLTPRTKFDLIGGFYLNRPTFMLDAHNTIGGDFAFAPTGLTAGANGYLMLTYPDATTVRFGTEYDGNLGGATWRDIQFGRKITPYMTIKDGGNVGIGLTGPASKLHVVSSEQVSYNTAIFENKRGDYSGFLYKATGGSGQYQPNLIFEDNRPDTTGSVNGFFNIYRTGALTKGDILRVGKNSSANDLVVSYNGYVGIGLTGPATNLHIAADEVYSQSISGQLYVGGSTNTGKRLMIGYDTTNNFGFIEGVNQGVAYSNVNINPYAGNVGIRTTTPYATLHTKGSVIVGNGPQTSVLSTNSLGIHENSGVDTALGFWQNGIASSLIGHKASDSILYLTNTTGGSTLGYLPNSIALKSNGNVGIGVDPTEKLDVNGNVKANEHKYSTGTNVGSRYNATNQTIEFYFS